MSRDNARRLLWAALVATITWPAPLTAQTVPQPTVMAVRAGDCRVRVDVPARTGASALEVQLNKGRIGRLDLDPGPQTVLLPLQAPLEEGDEVRARLDEGPWQTTSATPVDQGGRSSCGPVASPRAATDRDVFEASGFFGFAFDQFAPKIVGNYVAQGDVVGSGQVQSRRTAGLALDYRVLGGPRDRLQFWTAAYTFYGIRTTDIDCQANADSPLCAKVATTQDKYLFILEHASSLEAHFAPRLEFWTLQENSATPLRVFVGGQFGFVQVEGAPKVSEIDHLGVGVIVPSGPFRRSSIQWSMARNSLFESAGGIRFAVNGVLAFDLVPTLKERAAFWKYTGFGSWRAFVAISIDRNVGGPGPDAVQTYAGFLFDFRQAFRP
ncbi:MAG: hypothetical protein WBD07_07120 [Vicinamibacterales bacterium]